MTTKEGAVYKGVENDDWVRRPDGLVSRLVSAGLLPKNCRVLVLQLPCYSMKRSALFYVSFADLIKRQNAIMTYVTQSAIDDPKGIGVSPLVASQTMALLLEMVAHAHVFWPEQINTDATLQLLCKGVQNPVVYKAFLSGGLTGFNYLLNLIEEKNS
jgi:hypothetical protein